MVAGTIAVCAAEAGAPTPCVPAVAAAARPGAQAQAACVFDLRVAGVLGWPGLDVGRGLGCRLCLRWGQRSGRRWVRT